MAKIGDRVRYLNSTGGGVITRIEGKIAYVDDDGFETPVLLKELVVVMPAGHEPEVKGARLMFDQAAYDKGRSSSEPPKVETPAETPKPAPAPLPPAEETAAGEKLNISIAFEPADLKRLSSTTFNAVLVNDSNYRLRFAFLRRGADERAWSLVFEGDIEPQELMDLEQYTHETLGSIERIALQAIAFKPGKPFTLKAPVNVVRKLDLTKFHKLHCFRPGVYFESPVIEIPLVSDDLPTKQPDMAPLGSFGKPDEEKKPKSRKDDERRGKRKSSPADNPHKLLPPVEVDLHIGELVDTTAGMNNADMLRLQLDTVEKTMKAHEKRIGQKIVFIHGKGEGVLRDAVRKLLRNRYPKCELQDASFQEYGFGATLVTVH